MLTFGSDRPLFQRHLQKLKWPVVAVTTLALGGCAQGAPISPEADAFYPSDAPSDTPLFPESTDTLEIPDVTPGQDLGPLEVPAPSTPETLPSQVTETEGLPDWVEDPATNPTPTVPAPSTTPPAPQPSAPQTTVEPTPAPSPTQHPTTQSTPHGTPHHNNHNTPKNEDPLNRKNATRRPLIVVEGDSIASRGGSIYTYADRIANAYRGKADVSLQATGGDQLRPNLIGDIPRIKRLYDARRQANVVIIMAGTNDIAHGATGKQAYRSLKKMVHDYQQKGFYVTVLTSIQRQGHAGDARKDQHRRDYNNLIRRDKHIDQVIDVARMPQFSESNNAVPNNRKFYMGDRIHPTTAGHELIMAKIRNELLSKIKFHPGKY